MRPRINKSSDRKNYKTSENTDTKKRFSSDGDSASRSPRKRFDTDKKEGKPAFSKDKPFSKDRFSSNDDSKSRPYKKREDADGKGEKSRFSKDKPFQKDRSSSNDDSKSRPFKKRFDSDDKGEKSNYSKDKPFQKDRFSSNDDSKSRPFKKRFDSDDKGEKSSFSKDKPFQKDRFSSNDDGKSRPYKKRFDSDKPEKSDYSKDKPYKKEGESGEGEKKPFKKPFFFENDNDDRYENKREYKERKKIYSSDPLDDDEPERNSRSSSSYNKNTEGNDAPRKVIRTSDKKYESAENAHRKVIKKGATERVDEGGMRLNRYIAQSGVCSRREADIMIESGAVMVNGVIVTEMGIKVSPTDKVNVGGETLKSEKSRYILLNKPKDFITTMNDPQKRNTVMDLLGDACRERIYPVGRLDRNTTGLLLLTNDGDLAKKLTHPKYRVKKIYHVELDKPLAQQDLEKILNVVTLEDGPVPVDEIAYISPTTKKEVGVEIHIGRNRIVRRLFESLGYEVVKLDRVVFAGLTKKNLPRGKWRFLSEEELNMLKMNVFSR